MKKAELIEAIASKVNLSKADVERTLAAFTETVVSGVAQGSKITIPGLGSFERVERAARAGVNPSTGAKIQIAAKKAPKFKAAKGFKDQVAG